MWRLRVIQIDSRTSDERMLENVGTRHNERHKIIEHLLSGVNDHSQVAKGLSLTSEHS